MHPEASLPLPSPHLTNLQNAIYQTILFHHTILTPPRTCLQEESSERTDTSNEAGNLVTAGSTLEVAARGHGVGAGAGS
jgi:hypothetical protein